MEKSKSSISKAASYKEIGDFWDSHDLTTYWDQTETVEFEVDIQSEITYYSLGRELSESIRTIAKKRGVSANTLLNLWVQERLTSEHLKGANQEKLA